MFKLFYLERLTFHFLKSAIFLQNSLFCNIQNCISCFKPYSPGASRSGGGISSILHQLLWAHGHTTHVLRPVFQAESDFRGYSTVNQFSTATETICQILFFGHESPIFQIFSKISSFFKINWHCSTSYFYKIFGVGTFGLMTISLMTILV